MKYLPLLWAGLWRKRGRTVLILLQVAVAFALFGLLQGMKTGIDQSIASVGADLLITHTRQGWSPLPLAHLQQIRKISGVKAVLPRNFLMGTYQKPDQKVFALATTREGLETFQEKFDIKMNPREIDAWSHSRTAALVGSELAKKYGWKVGDRIPLQTSLRKQSGGTDWQFEMVGSFEDNFSLDGKNSEFMMINNDYLNEARAESKNTVAAFMVITTDPASSAQVTSSIDAQFANSADETRTEPLREIAQSNFESLGDVNFVVKAVISAVLFALLFSVGAMMMQSLRERTPELAVLKTLGFSDTTIFWLILSESLLLCAVSALAGLGIATLIFPLAKKYLFGISMPLSVAAVGLGIAALMALLSAALPAWRGRQLQVVDALAGR